MSIPKSSGCEQKSSNWLYLQKSQDFVGQESRRRAQWASSAARGRNWDLRVAFRQWLARYEDPGGCVFMKTGSLSRMLGHPGSLSLIMLPRDSLVVSPEGLWTSAAQEYFQRQKWKMSAPHNLSLDSGFAHYALSCWSQLPWSLPRFRKRRYPKRKSWAPRPMPSEVRNNIRKCLAKDTGWKRYWTWPLDGHDWRSSWNGGQSADPDVNSSS